MGKGRSALALIAILLAGSFAPLAGGLGRVPDNQMYTVLTQFSDNGTESVKLFYAQGTNSSTSIKIPSAAIIKSASVQMSGDLLDLQDGFTHDTTADFATGATSNLTIFNGTLVLRPFLDNQTYKVGNSPSGLAAGDVNYDGHTDLVSVNSADGTVGILLQNITTGRMDPQLTYAVGQGPQGVAIGDLNRDGRQDIAVACSAAGTLDVLLQASDGTMGTAVSYKSGNGTRAVAIGDLDHDGRKDAVTVNPTDNTLSVFLQNPRGGLYPAMKFTTGINPVSVAIGDINLDGSNEVVVVNRDDSSVDIFVQDPTLVLKKSATIDTGPTPECVAIGDINRDGRNDVVVAEQGTGSVGVFYQNSSGALGARLNYSACPAPSWVTIGDVSFDGRLDVIVASASSNELAVLYQVPDGSLSAPEEYPAGPGPICAVTGDLNYDGKNDIAVANGGASSVSVMLMRPTPPGTLPAQQTVISPTDPHGIRIADLNSDGLLDIGVASWTGNVLSVYAQNQAGGLAPRADYSAGTGACVDLVAADFNADGRIDAVTTSWTENVTSLFYQNDKGTMDPRITYPVGTACAMVGSGDLNSDGLQDFVTADHGLFRGTNISVYLGNASGGFDGPVNYSSGKVPTGISVGDLNSDGLDDIAVTNQFDNATAIVYQNQNGTFDAPLKLSLGAGSYPVGVVIADLNSDGRNDLAVVDGGTSTISVFLQDGSGKMTTPATTYSTGNSPYLIAAGDVDSDGRTDLVVSNINGATVGVFTQKADGTLNSQTAYSTGGNSQPTGVAIGDINGDGHNDIAVANEVSNNIGLFRQKFTSSMNGSYASAFRHLSYESYEATAYWNLSITGPGQNASVDISNDRGQTWYRVASGTPVDFNEGGTFLGYRVLLSSGALNQSPVLDDLTISYVMHSYPTNPAIDIGAQGTPIWNWTGPFGVSGQPATIDFTERLNATMQAGSPDADGNIHVPFVISSGSLGRLRISNLKVAYDLAPSAPELTNLRSDEFITTQTPTFKMTASDPDTGLLKFRFELSQDNFSTVRSGYSQLITTDNWDRPGYRSGETASYQLSPYDKLTVDGEYQWRAFTYDGTVWSLPSGIGRFRLDTRAPAAHVNVLPAYESAMQFNVSWSGSDPDPGSGLDPTAAFDIQYKDRESSPWMDLLAGTDFTSVAFTGTQGKTYWFQARARDAAGNLGAYILGNGDTQTMVDTTPPAGSAADDGEYTTVNTRLHATFTFTDFESHLVRYEYWIGTAQGANDTYGPAQTDSDDVTVTGLFLLNGTRYYFSVRAENGAGLWSLPVSADGIVVRLKQPSASIIYAGGVQSGTDIEISMGATDPNLVLVEEGQLEYRVAQVLNRNPANWSEWTPVGTANWSFRPGGEPYIFKGEPGSAYTFRYQARDRAQTYSDYADTGAVVRIDRPPVPKITGPAKITAGRSVAFNANATVDPDGDPVHFSWDFGDGKWAFGPEAKHTFSGAGRYTVVLYADDDVVNATATAVVEVHASSAGFNYAYVLVPLALFLALGLAVTAYAIGRRRLARSGPAQAVGQPVSHADYAPAVVPGSERVGPPLPPPTAEEVEANIAAARGELTELDALGVETVRTVKMLALAESFLADGNLAMASQYAKKTVKLARDQKSRRESEVDEDTARRFIGETQKLLDSSNVLGANVKQAKRLMGLSISFMADGNYVTGMQYSKKVRNMLEGLRERDGRPTTDPETVKREIEAAASLLAGIGRAGEPPSQAETELDTARMFLDEGDLPPAMEHAVRARALARDMTERWRSLTPLQWKDRMAVLKERVERQRADGLKTSEPLKMLKFSESFALQGNLEVATQYIRKAEKLMDDMAARARVDASRPGPDKGRMTCPRCGEDIEADWIVCAYCNKNLKPDNEGPASPEPGLAGNGTSPVSGGPGPRAPAAPTMVAPDLAAPVTVAPAPVAQRPERPVEGGRAPPAREVRVARPVAEGDAAAGKVAKVAMPVEEPKPGSDAQKQCPNCGLHVEPGWAICPVCETPLRK